MICSHGIDCEYVHTMLHVHGYGEIVTMGDYWHDEDEKCPDALNPATLNKRVSDIIDTGVRFNDDEAAHAEEDALHRELIAMFCPQWVLDEIERLNKADFVRWCA